MFTVGPFDSLHFTFFKKYSCREQNYQSGPFNYWTISISKLKGLPGSLMIWFFTPTSICNKQGRVIVIFDDLFLDFFELHTYFENIIVPFKIYSNLPN